MASAEAEAEAAPLLVDYGTLDPMMAPPTPAPSPSLLARIKSVQRGTLLRVFALATLLTLVVLWATGTLDDPLDAIFLQAVGDKVDDQCLSKALLEVDGQVAQLIREQKSGASGFDAAGIVKKADKMVTPDFRLFLQFDDAFAGEDGLAMVDRSGHHYAANELLGPWTGDEAVEKLVEIALSGTPQRRVLQGPGSSAGGGESASGEPFDFDFEDEDDDLDFDVALAEDDDDYDFEDDEEFALASSLQALSEDDDGESDDGDPFGLDADGKRKPRSPWYYYRKSNDMWKAACWQRYRKNPRHVSRCFRAFKPRRVKSSSSSSVSQDLLLDSMASEGASASDGAEPAAALAADGTRRWWLPNWKILARKYSFDTLMRKSRGLWGLFCRYRYRARTRKGMQDRSRCRMRFPLFPRYHVFNKPSHSSSSSSGGSSSKPKGAWEGALDDYNEEEEEEEEFGMDMYPAGEVDPAEICGKVSPHAELDMAVQRARVDVASLGKAFMWTARLHSFDVEDEDGNCQSECAVLHITSTPAE